MSIDKTGIYNIAKQLAVDYEDFSQDIEQPDWQNLRAEYLVNPKRDDGYKSFVSVNAAFKRIFETSTELRANYRKCTEMVCMLGKNVDSIPEQFVQKVRQLLYMPPKCDPKLIYVNREGSEQYYKEMGYNTADALLLSRDFGKGVNHETTKRLSRCLQRANLLNQVKLAELFHEIESWHKKQIQPRPIAASWSDRILDMVTPTAQKMRSFFSRPTVHVEESRASVILTTDIPTDISTEDEEKEPVQSA